MRISIGSETLAVIEAPPAAAAVAAATTAAAATAARSGSSKLDCLVVEYAVYFALVWITCMPACVRTCVPYDCERLYMGISEWMRIYVSTVDAYVHTLSGDFLRPNGIRYHRMMKTRETTQSRMKKGSAAYPLLVFARDQVKLSPTKLHADSNVF